MADDILLIGATGQIGRNIMIAAQGRVSMALARAPRQVRASGEPAILAFDADGWWPDGPKAWPRAAISTLPIWLLAAHVDALANSGVRRLVCFSTTSIYGKSDTRNAHERDVVARVSAAEDAVSADATGYGIGLTILRPTMIYGEGADRTIAAAARFILRFGVYPVHGAALGRRQPVHAADLAAGAIAALDTDGAAGRDYALGGGETLTYRDMIGRIFEVLGKPPRIVRLPMLPPVLDIAGALLPDSELTGDVARRMNMDLVFDDGSAGRDFGYTPRRFLSGGRKDLFGS